MIVHVLNKSESANVKSFNDKLSALDPTVLWQVKIIPYKAKRSTDQNSRLWKLYTELGLYIGHTPDEVHQLMGYKFLRELITVNGESFENIKSTTKLNTKEMADYQENIERFATQIGYYFEWI